MTFGTFTLVIDGERLDGTPENKARLHLVAQGPGTLRDDDGDEFKFPAQFAKSDGVSISLPYALTLFTDTAVGEGNSTTIGYEGFVRTDYGRVTFQFAAPQAGSTVQLVDLTDDVVTPISDLQVFRDEAEAARDAAAASETAAELAETNAASAVAAVSVVAAPTGVTATDEAALAAAHTALPAAGGIIRLRRGAYKINSVTLTKPVTLVGEGGALIGDGGLTPIRALTTIVSTSATADCLTLAGKGSTVLDLAVVNEAGSTPTAGTGIKVTGMSQGHIARVAVVGFWNNIETRGTYWTIDSCHIYDPVNFGLWGNNDTLGASYVDHGDYGVSNTVISTYYKTWAGVAGFKWTGGGGIRWVGNKINGGTQPGSPGSPRFQYGALLEATSTTGTTGEITMTGGGVANCTVACVRVTQSGTGAFVNIKISGMQINSSSGSCVGVYVGAASIGNINQIRDVTITDNTFVGIPGSAIVADFVTGLMIGPNHYAGTLGSPLVRLGSGTTQATPIHVNMSPQSVRADNITIVEDWRSYGNNADLDGEIIHDYQREWYETASSTDKTMYKVTPMGHGALLVRVTLSGYNMVSGRYFVIEQVRAFIRQGTGSVAVTTVGTDVGVGTAVADIGITYDTASVSGEVAIKTRTTNAGFPAATARIRLQLLGGAQSVRKGV